MHSSVVAEESRLRLILDSDGLADASSPLSTPGTDIPEVNMEDDISDMVSDETVEQSFMMEVLCTAKLNLKKVT